MSTNRNQMIGGFEDMIEKGQSTLKNSAKNSAGDVAKTTKNQITGGGSSIAQTDQGTNESASANQAQQNQQKTDEERIEFLSKLYGKNDESKEKAQNKNKQNQNSGSVKQAMGIPEKDPDKGKTPEEIAEIESLKKRLHSEYYQNLVNRPKPKEENAQEKNEREEHEQKMAELEEEKKKPKELPKNVKRGTAERSIGVSG